MPAHATSMGRVLLAGLPDAELESYFESATLKRFQPATVTDIATLRERVMRARADGYAVVDQELEEGLLAVAVPIHDRSGRTIAAINLSTLVTRHTAESVRSDLLPPLQRCAGMIERDLANVVSGDRVAWSPQ
jgi:IclR family pca regulon transcriptional regulator